jgi:transcriptional regulator with XRE-family HTH domain
VGTHDASIAAVTGRDTPGAAPLTVGGRIRDLRRRLGMTQTDLAGDDYSAAYISTIETDRRRPSRRLLEYLAPRLGVDVGTLSGGGSATWVIEMARDLRSGGRVKAARDLLERSLSSLERSGEISPAVLVVMHRELARTTPRGEDAEARRHLEQAVEHAGRAGVPPRELAISCLQLGHLHSRCGDHRAAAAAYRRAAETIVELMGSASS